MKIELEVSDDNEAAANPYWLVLDPAQNMSGCVHRLASQITGPFFSRESAEKYLKNRRYAYGKRAVVYCLSGYRSFEYKEACAIALEKKHETRP
jgi:hypothetical protein